MNPENAVYHSINEIKREIPERTFQFHLEGFFNWSGADARDAAEKLLKAFSDGSYRFLVNSLSIELVQEVKIETEPFKGFDYGSG